MPMIPPLPAYDAAMRLASSKESLEPVQNYRTAAWALRRLTGQDTPDDLTQKGIQLASEAKDTNPAAAGRHMRRAGEAFYGMPDRSKTVTNAPAPAPAPAPGPAIHTPRPENVAASPAPPPQKGPAAGPETAMAAEAAGNEGEQPAPVRGGGQDYHDRVKAVKLPNGKVVFTNVPGAYEEKGASQIDYGTAIEGVTGRPFNGGVNMVQAEDGTTVFAQPGGEAAVSGVLDRMTPEVAPPQSMDPVDIFERQQFRDQRLAQEQAKRSAAAGLAREEATARTSVAASEVDPLAAARLQAEAQYGGKMIDAEVSTQETKLALSLIGQIIARQNQIRATMPAGPEREAALEQLEQDKKLYLIAVRPQAASGLMRPDPYAAFGGMAPTPPGAAPAK